MTLLHFAYRRVISSRDNKFKILNLLLSPIFIHVFQGKSWYFNKNPKGSTETTIASYCRQKPRPRQWVRLESTFVEYPCIGLSNEEFEIFKTPKP